MMRYSLNWENFLRDIGGKQEEYLRNYGDIRGHQGNNRGEIKGSERVEGDIIGR